MTPARVLPFSPRCRWRPRASRCLLAVLLSAVVPALVACSNAESLAAPRSASAAEAPHASAAAAAFLNDLAVAIDVLLTGGSSPLLDTMTAGERSELMLLYGEGDRAPLWVDGTGRVTANAADALRLLEDAAIEGLDPGDYGVASLRRLMLAFTSSAESAADSALDGAELELVLSAGTLRYFRHLHMGRVDARASGFNLLLPAERHDFVTLLRSALAEGRIRETAADLAPPLPQYGLLRDMLARYRRLAAQPAFAPLPSPAASVRPGDSYAGLPALHERLSAFGDLDPDTPVPGTDAMYDEPLVSAVTRFQVRHGLAVDGVVGKATLAALEVPLSRRVRQIEMALERLRWLPDLRDDQRLVALNIPMFHLWGWDGVRPHGLPALSMRAIVGRALSTQTPVLADEIRQVIFRPYWNVPRSILRHEILPVLERDPGYLQRQRMEIVRGPGDNAQPVPATADNLMLLRQGGLRLRQQPGPHNALGLVKFDFPNDANVYLHGTPARQLFARSRRDFSHGCVRVEDPETLAEWILKDEPGWSREQIASAMSAPRSQRVTLRRPVRVILFYVTAVVMPEDGTIRFAEDIYAHDAMLDRALVMAGARAG